RAKHRPGPEGPSRTAGAGGAAAGRHGGGPRRREALVCASLGPLAGSVAGRIGRGGAGVARRRRRPAAGCAARRGVRRRRGTGQRLLLARRDVRLGRRDSGAHGAAVGYRHRPRRGRHHGGQQCGRGRGHWPSGRRRSTFMKPSDSSPAARGPRFPRVATRRLLAAAAALVLTAGVGQTWLVRAQEPPQPPAASVPPPAPALDEPQAPAPPAVTPAPPAVTPAPPAATPPTPAAGQVPQPPAPPVPDDGSSIYVSEWRRPVVRV